MFGYLSLSLHSYIYVYIHTLYYRKNSALTLRLKRIKLPFRSVLLCVLCIHTYKPIYIYIIQEPIYTHRSCWTTYTRARHTRKGMYMKIIMVNMDLFNRTFFVCDVFFCLFVYFFIATVARRVYIDKYDDDDDGFSQTNKSNRSLTPAGITLPEDNAATLYYIR